MYMRTCICVNILTVAILADIAWGSPKLISLQLLLIMTMILPQAIQDMYIQRTLLLTHTISYQLLEHDIGYRKIVVNGLPTLN